MSTCPAPVRPPEQVTAWIGSFLWERKLSELTTCRPSPTPLSSRQTQVLVWPRAFFQRMLFHMAWPGCPRLDDFSLNMSRLQQERRAYRGVGFGGWPWLYSEEFIFGGNGRYIKWLNGQGTCTLPRRSCTELQQENVTFQHLSQLFECSSWPDHESVKKN